MKIKRIFLQFIWVFILVFVVSCDSKGPAVSPLGASELNLRVFAQQFQWTFQNPGKDGKFDTDDDIFQTNDLNLPVGSKVIFSLESRDVLHGFWIPSLGVRQLAIPGAKPVHVEVYLDKIGNHKLACSEICGANHGQMMGWVHILSQEDYKKWISN